MIKGKRAIFTVQGEGRGHLTQAITLQNILTEAGYEVCAVLVGTSSARKLPDFFHKQIKAPIINFSSPNFVMDSKMKSIRILPSITFNLKLMPLYFRNMRMIDRKLKELKPDLLINFYDPLIGMYYLLFNPTVPLVCIAHQYTFIHPDFEFPEGFFWEKTSLRIFTWLTASRAKKKLALSMYPLKNIEKHKIYVMPPLLREAVYSTEATEGNYILVYLLNAVYMEDIIKWHNQHPETALHCFTDKKEIEKEWVYDNTLSFHQINDKKFLELMAGCRAFATTAGFESICEAMYFGKPVYMVPVDSHFEQYSNARDGARAGAGIYGSKFDLDNLMDYLKDYKSNHAAYREWAVNSWQKVLQQIEN